MDTDTDYASILTAIIAIGALCGYLLKTIKGKKLGEKFFSKLMAGLPKLTKLRYIPLVAELSEYLDKLVKLLIKDPSKIENIVNRLLNFIKEMTKNE